jgi:endonuclease VIII
MPEGPSLVILKDEIKSFVDSKVVDAKVNSKNIACTDIVGKKITAIKTWGKHLLLCLPDFTIRIHLLMFGSYRINEEKDNAIPRLQLFFARKRSIAFYACAVRRIDEPLDIIYDWEADVMNVNWNNRKALKKLRQIPETLVCDALLDQQIFSGVGNIIKNEVLFRIRVHPLSKLGKLPAQKLRQLVEETVRYCYQFFEWKKRGQLKRNWLAHTKKICPRDHVQFIKEHLGKSRRRTFYCDVCQRLYE